MAADSLYCCRAVKLYIRGKLGISKSRVGLGGVVVNTPFA